MWSRSEQEKGSEPLPEALTAVSSGSARLHCSLCFPTCLLPHPLQDLARMAREKHTGSHVFIKPGAFQRASKNQTNTSRPAAGPLPAPSSVISKEFALLPQGTLHKTVIHTLSLPFFSCTFVKRSQFQEIVIQNVGEVAEFWLGRSYRCYFLRKTIMIACVSNGCELAKRQKFSYSRMYKPFSYWKKAPSRIICYYTWFKLQDLQQGSSWLIQDSRPPNTDVGMMECLMN